MSDINPKVISLTDAVCILAEGVIVPGASGDDDAKPHVGADGAVRISGDLAGSPRQLASAVIYDHLDGMVTFSISVRIPVRSEFSSTILMDPMLTRENVEAFANHVRPRILAEAAPNIMASFR